MSDVTTDRRADAVTEFNQHENRQDGAAIVNSLIDGLRQLRDTFFERVHRDVEINLGMDSMLLPISEPRSALTTNTEIEIFQVAEVAATVRELQFVRSEDNWFTTWLGRLWIGEAYTNAAVARRLDGYVSQSSRERRRAFSTRIVQVFPEAGQAPLVIFRLFPLAVSLAACVAFRDLARAATLRQEQRTWLPNLDDCHACRGFVLENSEKCPQCGNPFWKYAWLTAE